MLCCMYAFEARGSINRLNVASQNICQCALAEYLIERWAGCKTSPAHPNLQPTNANGSLGLSRAKNHMSYLNASHCAQRIKKIYICIFLLVGFNISRYVWPKKWTDPMPETCATIWKIEVQEMLCAKATEELQALPVPWLPICPCIAPTQKRERVRIRSQFHLGGQELFLNHNL